MNKRKADILFRRSEQDESSYSRELFYICWYTVDVETLERSHTYGMVE